MRLVLPAVMALAALVSAAPSCAAQEERPPSVQDLIRELKSGAPYERASAAVALGNRGPEAKEAAPALIEALKDRQSVRCYVRDAIQGIGLEDATGLIPILKEEDSDVRRAAARVLGEIGPAAKTAVPALIEMVGDADAKVRYAALTALAKIGPAPPEVVPAIVKALQDKDPVVRSGAMYSLGEIGSGGRAGEVIPTIVKYLKDRDWKMRGAAACALGEIGPAAAEALPALLEALKTPDDGSHDWIGYALWKICPLKAEAVPELIDIFTGRDRDDRWEAVWALSRLGAAAKPAEPKLIIAVREDWDPNVRWAAAAALRSLRPVSNEALTALVRAAEDGEIRVRIAAVDALAWEALHGREEAAPAIRQALADVRREIRLAAIPCKRGTGMGSTRSPPPIVAEYVPLLKDKDDEIREAAAQTIASFARARSRHFRRPGPNLRPPPPLPALTAIIPDLVRMLKEDPDRLMRYYAATILGGLGPEVKEVKEIAAALIEALEVKDDSIPYGAIRALGALGPVTPEVVPALVKASTSEEQQMRWYACGALGEIGVADPAVVPALVRALGDEYIVVRFSAADALRDIGPDAKAAAPALIENLKARNNIVPVHAAQALVRMGIKDAAIVPAMVRALRDRSWSTRRDAAGVLRDLGPEASDATGALCEVVRADKEESPREEALMALLKIVPPADDVTPTLIAALGDEKVRMWAARVLAATGFGKHGKACVAALKPLLADPNEMVRSAAIDALKKAQDSDLDPETAARLRENLSGPGPDP